MIIVIPFSADADYRRALADALRTHGGLGSHRLLHVIPEQEDSPFFEEVRDLFFGAAVHRVKADPGVLPARLLRDGMWAATNLPLGPNEPPAPPLLWMEPGWIPASREWANEASTAFFSCGFPVLARWEKLPDTQVKSAGVLHTVGGGTAPVGPFVTAYLFPRSSVCFRQIFGGDWREVMQHEFSVCKSDFTSSPFIRFEGTSAARKPRKVEQQPAEVAA